MSDTPASLAENVKPLAREYIKGIVRNISDGLGGHAADAVQLDGQTELMAWMRATASPEEIAKMIEEGADDETILKTARKYRYELGRSAGKNDPEKEARYHESMQRKAQAFMAARMPQPAPTPVPVISSMMPMPAPPMGAPGQSRPQMPLMQPQPSQMGG